MKKIGKLTALVMAGTMAISLCACSKSNEENLEKELMQEFGYEEGYYHKTDGNNNDELNVSEEDVSIGYDIPGFKIDEKCVNFYGRIAEYPDRTYKYFFDNEGDLYRLIDGQKVFPDVDDIVDYVVFGGSYVICKDSKGTYHYQNWEDYCGDGLSFEGVKGEIFLAQIYSDTYKNLRIYSRDTDGSLYSSKFEIKEAGTAEVANLNEPMRIQLNFEIDIDKVDYIDAQTGGLNFEVNGVNYLCSATHFWEKGVMYPVNTLQCTGVEVEGKAVLEDTPAIVARDGDPTNVYRYDNMVTGSFTTIALPEGYTVNDIKLISHDVLILNDNTICFVEFAEGDKREFRKYDGLDDFDKSKIVDVFYGNNDWNGSFHIVCDDNCLYINQG